VTISVAVLRPVSVDDVKIRIPIVARRHRTRAFPKNGSVVGLDETLAALRNLAVIRNFVPVIFYAERACRQIMAVPL
jgi:hypothetical protein